MKADVSTFQRDFLPEVQWSDDPIRVLVCDDHALFRRRLVVALDQEPDIEVLGEADTGPEAMTLAGDLGPDVVLIDLGLQPYGGVAAVSQVNRVVPTTRIVLLAANERDPDELLEGFGAGAVGSLLKEASPRSAASAIRRVADREMIVTPVVATAMIELMDGLAGGEDRGAPGLEVSDRERLVVQVVARGAHPADASSAGGFSPATARNLLANATRKLQRYWRMEDAVVSLSAPRTHRDHLSGVAEAARRLVGSPEG